MTAIKARRGQFCFDINKMSIVKQLSYITERNLILDRLSIQLIGPKWAHILKVKRIVLRCN